MSYFSRLATPRRYYIVHNGITQRVNLFTMVQWLFHRRIMQRRRTQ